MSFIELDPIDRDQGHAQITHLFEQSMQCGLIDHWAGQKRIAVFLQRDGQALKPVCPLLDQMAFDPDLIDHGLTWSRFWFAFV